MHASNESRMQQERQSNDLNKVDVFVEGTLVGGAVGPAGREGVAGSVDQGRVVEVSEEGEETASVPVVCHPAPVVALPRQIAQCVVLHILSAAQGNRGIIVVVVLTPTMSGRLTQPHPVPYHIGQPASAPRPPAGPLPRQGFSTGPLE